MYDCPGLALNLTRSRVGAPAMANSSFWPNYLQDIRSIEIETAELLKKTMRAAEGGYEPGYDINEEGETATG